MANKTQQELLAELQAAVPSGGIPRKTTAQDVRTFLASLIDELIARTDAPIDFTQLGLDLQARLEELTTKEYVDIQDADLLSQLDLFKSNRANIIKPDRSRVYYATATAALAAAVAGDVVSIPSPIADPTLFANQEQINVTGGVSVFTNGFNIGDPNAVGADVITTRTGKGRLLGGGSNLYVNGNGNWGIGCYAHNVPEYDLVDFNVYVSNPAADGVFLWGGGSYQFTGTITTAGSGLRVDGRGNGAIIKGQGIITTTGSGRAMWVTNAGAAIEWRGDVVLNGNGLVDLSHGTIRLLEGSMYADARAAGATAPFVVRGGGATTTLILDNYTVLGTPGQPVITAQKVILRGNTTVVGDIVCDELVDLRTNATGSGGTGSTVSVVQSTGVSTTDVMSQKAVTDALATKVSDTDPGLIKKWVSGTPYEQYDLVQHRDSLFIKSVTTQPAHLTDEPQYRTETWVNLAAQTPLDNWNNGSLYQRGISVLYNNKAYICLDQSYDNQPDVSPFEWLPLGGGTATVTDGSITTSKLADLSVTESKLAEASITSTKLDNNAVTSTKIQDEAVTEVKLDVALQERLAARYSGSNVLVVQDANQLESGIKGRWDRPYRTLNQAIAAADFGDTIYVLPSAAGIIMDNASISKSLTIVGIGRPKVGIYWEAGSYAGRGSAGRDIKILGFEFTEQIAIIKPGAGSNTVLFEDCWFTGNGQALLFGLQIFNPDIGTTTFRRCRFDNQRAVDSTAYRGSINFAERNDFEQASRVVLEDCRHRSSSYPLLTGTVSTNTRVVLRYTTSLEALSGQLLYNLNRVNFTTPIPEAEFLQDERLGTINGQPVVASPPRTTLEFVFQAGFADKFSTMVGTNQAATYTNAILSNITSAEYKKNGSLVNLPFSIAAGDALLVDIIRANTALGAVLTLNS